LPNARLYLAIGFRDFESTEGRRAFRRQS